jgi:ribosome modulation factor
MWCPRCRYGSEAVVKMVRCPQCGYDGRMLDKCPFKKPGSKAKREGGDAEAQAVQPE